MADHTLVIESATSHGSVAVLHGGDVVAEVTVETHPAVHGERRETLAPAVERCLAGAGVAPHTLARIVVGAGPGGFTSLRTGAAIAKGMCFTLGLPLHAVSSIELLARSVPLDEGSYVVLLDAGRDEVFRSDVTVHRGTVDVAPARLARTSETLADALARGVRTIGPGFDIHAFPRAGAAAAIVATAIAAPPVDVDVWEPSYGRLAEAQARWEAAHSRALRA